MPLLVAYWTETSALALPTRSTWIVATPADEFTAILHRLELNAHGLRREVLGEFRCVAGKQIGRGGAHPRVRGNAVLRRERDRGQSVGVGRDRLRSQQRLALAVSLMDRASCC